MASTITDDSTIDQDSLIDMQSEEEELRKTSDAHFKSQWLNVVSTAKKRSLSPNSIVNNNKPNSDKIRKPNKSSTIDKIKIPLFRDPRLNKTNSPVVTPNRYAPLETTDADTDTSKKFERPPPIYLKSDVNYTELCNLLTQLVGADNFTCLSTKNGITIYPSTPDIYRKLFHYFKQNGAEFHTFQLQEEKAFRIVLRGLHYSVKPEVISQELTNLGYKVRSVCNVISFNKERLPLFFIDLEPYEKNENIFSLNYLLYSKIQVEEPRKKRNIIQCVRCQQYGHTKRYCNLSPRCVRCAGPHESETCTKQRDTAATCALCGEPHPANYRGCSVHKILQNRRSSATMSRNKSTHASCNPAPVINSSSFPSLSNSFTPTSAVSCHPQSSPQQPENSRRSYSSALSEPRNPSQPSEETKFLSHLSSFMSEMKSLLTPMITMMSQLLQVLLSRSDK